MGFGKLGSIVKGIGSAVQDAWVPVRNAAEDAASVALGVYTYGASVPFTSKMVSDSAATSDNKLFKLDKDKQEAQNRAVETARLQGEAYRDAMSGVNFSQPGAANLLGAYRPSSSGEPAAVVVQGQGGGGISPVFLLLLAAGAFYVFKKR